jgi:hypothetical protein
VFLQKKKKKIKIKKEEREEGNGCHVTSMLKFSGLGNNPSKVRSHS